VHNESPSESVVVILDPSVSAITTTAGGPISIQAALLELTFTGIPEGLEARVKKGSTSLAYDSSVVGNFVYQYPFVPNSVIDVTIGGVGNNGLAYERQNLKITLPNTSSTIPLQFSLNPSYE
jgi:hypothetical protein